MGDVDDSCNITTSLDGVLAETPVKLSGTTQNVSEQVGSLET